MTTVFDIKNHIAFQVHYLRDLIAHNQIDSAIQQLNEMVKSYAQHSECDELVNIKGLLESKGDLKQVAGRVSDIFKRLQSHELANIKAGLLLMKTDSSQEMQAKMQHACEAYQKLFGQDVQVLINEMKDKKNELDEIRALSQMEIRSEEQFGMLVLLCSKLDEFGPLFELLDDETLELIGKSLKGEKQNLFVGQLFEKYYIDDLDLDKAKALCDQHYEGEEQNRAYAAMIQLVYDNIKGEEGSAIDPYYFLERAEVMLAGITNKETYKACLTLLAECYIDIEGDEALEKASNDSFKAIQADLLRRIEELQNH